MTRLIRPGIWEDGEPALKLLTVTWREPACKGECELKAAFALPEGAQLRAVIINGVRYIPEDDR
jgi:hypothetical protein